MRLLSALQIMLIEPSANLTRAMRALFLISGRLNIGVTVTLSFFTAQKTYDELAEFADKTVLAVDPSFNEFLYPTEDRGLEVEIRGMFEIGPDDLQHLIK